MCVCVYVVIQKVFLKSFYCLYLIFLLVSENIYQIYKTNITNKILYVKLLITQRQDNLKEKLCVINLNKSIVCVCGNNKND